LKLQENKISDIPVGDSLNANLTSVNDNYHQLKNSTKNDHKINGHKTHNDFQC
jgi:hypothetical protein